MRTFTHLTKEERYHIYLMYKKKVSLEEIVKDIGRSKLTTIINLFSFECNCRFNIKINQPFAPQQVVHHPWTKESAGHP